jgi:drug/metabolite transporter (DMT)-like permease
MGSNDSAIAQRRTALSRGLAWGLLGVLAFSLTLPTTQVTVRQLGPIFASAGRASLAAAFATAYLAWRHAPIPPLRLWPSIVVVAVGAVIGFPLCTAIALQHESSSHGAVIVGLLPAATAILGVLRSGERPSRAFWVACAAGAVAVTAFAIVRGQGVPSPADGLTLLAVVAAAISYAEGSHLGRALGSDRVICWALIAALPVTVPALLVEVVHRQPSANTSGWACFAYTAAISMFLGFFAWYRGLALGGIAKVSQVQLAQPLLTVAASVVIFGQRLEVGVVIAAVAVLVCVGAAQRARVRPAPIRA